MKTRVWVFWILVFTSFSTAFAASDGKMKLSFRTTEVSGKYAPQHVAAIWVTDKDGAFVKTLAVYGRKEKKRLKKWAERSNKNEVDAVTGATLNDHERHSVRWDCRDAAGDAVPDGEYCILIEYTCTNKAGPVTPDAYIRFTKGSKPVSLRLKDLENFENIKLTYKP